MDQPEESPDKLDDIRPSHFALRESDRSDKGVINRLYDEMTPESRQKLLSFAIELLRSQSGERK